jgi:hypothetical protein
LTQSPDLLSRFQEIIAREPISTIETEDQECVSMLYETDWTRIFLVQRPEKPECIGIEVEISPPSPSLSQVPVSMHTPNKDERATRWLLEHLIEHIEYILRLESSEFTIEFVGSDCLILAFKSFEESPPAEIFELLLPPS